MVEASRVREVLERHVRVDGYDLVLDLEASHGSWLVDARDRTRYLDMFGFFASSPLGMNHPALTEDPAFAASLARVARAKPSNGDVPTRELADFVETFERVMGDPALPRLFLISGGALAVENALKAAFDWKQQHNAANGRPGDLGTKVLHLTRAFHGRTGYTMSLTNTEPVKIARYPKFDWPRIDVPAMRFPVADNLADIESAEEHAVEQAARAFEENLHDIACFIAEPIQGEGGDNHLRAEFLQRMQRLCQDNDALFVLDEVQTGGGATGTPWCYQQLGLEPDLVAFGKKLQICGVMAGRRIDEVADNVFTVGGRIDSTWGGNLTDMVRSAQALRAIEADGLIAQAGELGTELVDRLLELADRHARVTNVRGRGLLAAADLPDRETRDEVLRRLFGDERMVLLGCGERSLRFRPHLAVTAAELGDACDRVDRVLTGIA